MYVVVDKMSSVKVSVFSKAEACSDLSQRRPCMVLMSIGGESQIVSSIVARIVSLVLTQWQDRSTKGYQ